MRTHHTLTSSVTSHAPWDLPPVGVLRGGRDIVPTHQAPLGQLLPYRRGLGEAPETTQEAENVAERGWRVELGQRGLGDVLLGLGAAQALVDTGLVRTSGLHYSGPRTKLLERCGLSPRTAHAADINEIRTDTAHPVTFAPLPEKPPLWLDPLDEHHTEVHAALPMRYYLAVEQQLGLRLPATHAPLPTFTSERHAEPFHVVFVATTSRPERKDYGIAGFRAITRSLKRRRRAAWRFTLITAPETAPAADTELSVLSGVDAAECVDVFAAAEVVIGNDTGLTHLAALTNRSDGTGAEVIGLYSRHAHTKWTTGRERHHGLATWFSQMLSAADRCPVRDHLDDTLWGTSSAVDELPAETVADIAGQCAGWW